jgi:hypothetical protein
VVVGDLDIVGVAVDESTPIAIAVRVEWSRSMGGAVQLVSSVRAPYQGIPGFGGIAMRAAPRLLILAGLIQAASPASAEFFGIPLPELVGSAPVYGGPPIEVPFDFGQEFEEVENVMLMMEATVTPLVYESCGVTWDEAVPCERRIVNVGFLVELGGPGLDRTTAVVEGFREPFPVQPPTSTQPNPKKQVGVFGRSFGDFSFDHLTVGSGTLRVWWNGISFAYGNTEGAPERAGPTSSEAIGSSILVPGDGNWSPGIQSPTGTIIDAVLIVEATPLAEPVVECPGRWPGRAPCRGHGSRERGLGPPGR